MSNGGWHYYGLYVGMTANGGGTFDGWVVRNNTFENDARVEAGSGSGSRWVGNVGTWDCVDGVTYRRNVGKRCGSSDKSISPARSTADATAGFAWVNPAQGDFRLRAGSPAINAADPADAPARDRAGLVRDAKPDAGAHEYGPHRLHRHRPRLIPAGLGSPARNGTSVDPGLEKIVVRPSRRMTSNVASRTVAVTAGTLLQIVWSFHRCLQRLQDSRAVTYKIACRCWTRSTSRPSSRPTRC